MQEIIFFPGQNIYIIGHFEGHFCVKKIEAPLKNPKKCPIICFAPDKKNNPLHFQNQRYIGILYFLKRERGGRGREEERARVRAIEREKERKRKREKSEGDYSSKLPRPK